MSSLKVSPSLFSSKPPGPITSSNWSIHRSRELRDYKERTRLTFEGGWNNSQSNAFKWYNTQPFRRFQTIQYRKEKSGVQHEFVLILLQCDELSRDPFCRLERVADPFHQLEAIGVHGTTAYDFVQTFDSYDAEFTKKDDHNSQIVAQIKFPYKFDLCGVLATCYGISCHREARRYTLQQYNCYFFSWTIILVLARSCADLQGFFKRHKEAIQTRILDCVTNELDSTKLTVIISRIHKTTAKGQRQSELVNAFTAEISDPRFSRSLDESLGSLLWQDLGRSKLKPALEDIICRVANRTVDLFTGGLQSRSFRDTCSLKKRSTGAIGRSEHPLVSSIQSDHTESLVSQVVLEAVVIFNSQLRDFLPKSLCQHRKEIEKISKERLHGCKGGGVSCVWLLQGGVLLPFWMFVSPAILFGSIPLGIRGAVLMAHYENQLTLYNQKSGAQRTFVKATNTIRYIPAHSFQCLKTLITLCSLTITFSIDKDVCIFQLSRIISILRRLRCAHIGVFIPWLSEVISGLRVKYPKLDTQTLGRVVVGVLRHYDWLLDKETGVKAIYLWENIMLFDFQESIARAIMDVITKQKHTDAPTFEWVSNHLLNRIQSLIVISHQTADYGAFM